MFFWCCGPRERKAKDIERQPGLDEPPTETDWLLGGDPPAEYIEDSVDNPSNGEADFLRDILREAEGKMINVTHDEPFQFRANTFHHTLGNGSGLDVASDSPSHGSYASLRDDNDRHLYSPTGSGRGRNADRRQKRHHSPLVPAQRAPGVRRNINGSGGSGTGSSDTRRRGGAQRNTSGVSRAAQGHGNGNGNVNAKASRSSSRDGSFRSGYSSYSYDPAYDDDDDGYRGYGEYDEDSFDPEEEAHIRRLRGPKLNAHILPLPARQIELEEEEERHRREDAEFAQGDEGETTPVQEHTSMSMTPKPQIPKNITAEPLSQEDHDAIVALGDALWKALEDGLRITEPPKIIHGWED